MFYCGKDVFRVVLLFHRIQDKKSRSEHLRPHLLCPLHGLFQTFYWITYGFSLEAIFVACKTEVVLSLNSLNFRIMFNWFNWFNRAEYKQTPAFSNFTFWKEFPSTSPLTHQFVLSLLLRTPIKPTEVLCCNVTKCGKGVWILLQGTVVYLIYLGYVFRVVLTLQLFFPAFQRAPQASVSLVFWARCRRRFPLTWITLTLVLQHHSPGCLYSRRWNLQGP